MENISIRWSALVLRGLAGVLFGAIALLSPAITLAALIILFAGYALADGTLNLISAAKAMRSHQRSMPLILEGVAGIGIGLFTMFWPGLTALVLLYVIAIWAVLTGVLEIAAGIHLRTQVHGEWLMALSGALSLVLGVLLFAYPGAGALAIVIWLGAYGIVFGSLLMALALRLRSWTRHHAPWDEHAAPSAA